MATELEYACYEFNGYYLYVKAPIGDDNTIYYNGDSKVATSSSDLETDGSTCTNLTESSFSWIGFTYSRYTSGDLYKTVEDEETGDDTTTESGGGVSMSLYVGSDKIKDTGEYGVYYGSTPIEAIYYGSELVYQYHPYDIGYVILYGANTGTMTYTLPKGVYQCCVVGGGIGGSWWSKAGGAAAEIQFRLTSSATVVVSSGSTSADGYLEIDGARVVTASGCTNQNNGGTYTIDTASSYYVSTIMASNGNGANLSTAASVSPYETWGAGNTAGGARLAYVGA